MTYDQWESAVPAQVREDTLWRVKAYRLGLFLSDLAWNDAAKLVRTRRTLASADQLYRAACNVSSNVGEGYSRGTGKDRARFYEYGLGSVRECRDWYYKSRHVLGEAVTPHRLDLCCEIIRLLLKMVANERRTNRRPQAE